MSYYEILGVERTATQAEIKLAYKKLAQKHHPDKDGDNELFQQIQEAYAVLKNPNHRAHYDETGDTRFRNERYAAINTLTQFFMNWLQQNIDNPGRNCVADIRQTIQDSIKKLDKDIEAFPEKIKKLDAHKDKVKNKSDTDDNLYDMVVMNAISTMKDINEKMKLHKLELQHALELLEDYEFTGQLWLSQSRYSAFGLNLGI